jgi:hypothetical protein
MRMVAFNALIGFERALRPRFQTPDRRYEA